ncbi:MAG: winged helix-turn-helix domain-containing protein, partial [Pseudaminobacter sp.]
MLESTVRMKEQATQSTRAGLVMATIRQRIAGRSLTPGARLPSIRRLAATLGVSPSTVVEGYDRLVAEGTIHSRPGSGFYVASQAAPLSLSQIGPKVD